jgi:glycosyltransferase involved in cell wall biosynthesis
MKVPVLQTLHNYRMLCANANLFRDGEVCEECIGKSLYHGVKYGCYRSSRVQTFAVARMIESNKKKGMWDGGVDGYIALTNFSKNKFIKEGMPAAKIFVKPNFLFEDPGYSGKDENYFIFAGRLDETKGIDVLIEAANELPGVKFKVAGDGPLKEKVTAVPNIEYLGQLKKNELLEYIKSSTALVFPSKSYETFGLSIIEAFACYKPVIGSKLGAMAEIIEDGKTGLLFEPGSAKALVEKIEWAIKNKDEMKQMGINARKEYEEKYSAEKNYEMLMYIYNNL